MYYTNENDKNLSKAPPKNEEDRPAIGSDELHRLNEILHEYKNGKANLERRIVAAEDWWKLRNAARESHSSDLFSSTKDFASSSGWLHNTIVSKHADAMEAYPEPNILPREAGDKAEARMLSAIIPCVLEQNHFEDTYSDAMWLKMKSGTGVYKVFWNSAKLGGLGDIEIIAANILNLFWEPGIKDIQKSRYFFQTELVDKDLLLEKYPEQLADGIGSDGFTATKFLYDDTVKTDGKATVIDVYYHKHIEGRDTLQYIKYIGETVLYATENDNEPIIDALSGEEKPPMSVTGLYDHGKYPYVFDPLFPVEGSPCGYGYVDLNQNPQTEIDILKTSFVHNARIGSKPRYFVRDNGIVNPDDLTDLKKDFIPVKGDVGENILRRVDYLAIDGSYLGLLDRDINELRETSGNTEASTGSVPSGVTSGAAIAALQTAAGKGSKDSTRASYRKYSQIIELCIELIRQFYTLPRKFRILGQYGTEEYITYTNSGLQAQGLGNGFGVENGLRVPTFDIKVSAQTQSAYTKISQNELAIQLFKLGFCNPQMTDQALMCLEMMDFDGKDAIAQRISQNGTVYDKLRQYMQLALVLSQKAAPEYTEQIAQDIAATSGGASASGVRADGSVDLKRGDAINGIDIESEHPTVEKARMHAEEAALPGGSK